MTIRICLAAALALLLVPASAVAKGASAGTITGPGLAEPIELTGVGEGGSVGTLGRVAEEAGFYPAVFQTTPNPMLAKAPTSDLGPRYVVEYVMPGPNNQTSKLVQEH